MATALQIAAQARVACVANTALVRIHKRAKCAGQVARIAGVVLRALAELCGAIANAVRGSAARRRASAGRNAAVVAKPLCRACA